MKVFVATKNRGKLDELVAIFAGSGLDLTTDPQYEEPVEGEESYAENAAIKARALRAQLKAAGVDASVLADDSGLEVDALGGRPGVLSARFAGKEATWSQRRHKILEELSGVPESRRGATFCCAMMLIAGDGTELASYGEVEGIITEREFGEHGFGYDPIFWYPQAGRTFAQLTEEEKNRVSHRRRAADALLKLVRERG